LIKNNITHFTGKEKYVNVHTLLPEFEAFKREANQRQDAFEREANQLRHQFEASEREKDRLQRQFEASEREAKQRQDRTDEDVFTLTAARAVIMATQEVLIFIGDQPRGAGCSNKFTSCLDLPEFCTMLEYVFGALEDAEKRKIATSLDKMCDERNAVAHPGSGIIRWEAVRLIESMQRRECRHALRWEAVRLIESMKRRECRHALRSEHKSALTILQNRQDIRKFRPCRKNLKKRSRPSRA
jgi:hypothetical protein